MARCVAIGWDNLRRVYGVRLEKKSGRAPVRLCEFCECTDESLSFIERLSHVCHNLYRNENDLVVIGGAIMDMICLELKIPYLRRKALTEAIDFELRCMLPTVPDDTIYSYKRVRSEYNSSSAIRLQVIRAEHLQRLNAALKKAGVKADFLLHPFMAVDPILSKQSLYMPDVDRDYYLSKCDEDTELRTICAVDVLDELPDILQISDLSLSYEGNLPLAGGYAVAALLGSYVLSNDFKQNKNTLRILPVELNLKNFVGLMKITVGLLVIMFFLMTTIMIRSYYADKGVKEDLDLQLGNIQREVSALERENSRIVNRAKVIDKFCDSTQNDEKMLRFLSLLTTELPESMWITNISYTAHRFALTVYAKNGSPSIYDILEKLGGSYKILELDRRPDADRGSIINLTVSNEEDKK